MTKQTSLFDRCFLTFPIGVDRWVHNPTFDRFWRKREKIRKNNAETRMKSLKILDF